MFRHVFSYRLRYLLRNRQMVFWTMLFPILMSIFFSLAFSNLYTAETFRKIPIAVVDSEAYRSDAVFRNVLQSVSAGDDALFQVTVVNQEKAQQLLDTGAAVGIVDAQGGLHATVSSAGIGQTILKSFLDSYLQMTLTAKTLIAQNPTAAFTGLMDDLSAQKAYVKPLSGMPEPETLLAFFYALLAMACMYGSFWGAQEVMDIQANLSAQGGQGMCCAHSQAEGFSGWNQRCNGDSVLRNADCTSFYAVCIECEFRESDGLCTFTKPHRQFHGRHLWRSSGGCWPKKRSGHNRYTDFRQHGAFLLFRIDDG